MANKLNIGPVRRFGSRYGRRVRHKVAMVENNSKKEHKCPYCTYVNVKKVSLGIFYCSKCDTKFTGRAYTPSINKITTEKQDPFHLNLEKEKAREERQRAERDEEEALLAEIKQLEEKKESEKKTAEDEEEAPLKEEEYEDEDFSEEEANDEETEIKEDPEKLSEKGEEKKE